jgi:hypothetical protein
MSSTPVTIEGYPFACVRLADADFTDIAAIYAVLCVAQDGNWIVLDIGQSGELGKRINDHDRMQCWIEKCSNKNVWVCVHRMPSDKFSKEDRLELEKYLREKLKPPCGSR